MNANTNCPELSLLARTRPTTLRLTLALLQSAQQVLLDGGSDFVLARNVSLGTDYSKGPLDWTD